MTQNSSEDEVVAALPAGGWRVQNTDKREVWSEPLVGWLVYKSGKVRAIVGSPDGDPFLMDPERDFSEAEIFHPDHTLEKSK